MKISVKKYPRRAVLAAGSAFHFFHDGIADGLAIFLPLWQSAFGLTLTNVGLLVCCFEGTTGLFQIPAGLLGERFGERTLLISGTLLTAISFMFLGLVGGLTPLVFLLIIGGMGAAVQHPLASSIVANAYKDFGRRIALGTYNFSGDIGKFLFPLLAAAALSQTDWRMVCFGFGLLGCVVTATVLPLLKHITGAVKATSGVNPKVPSQKQGWGIINKGAFSTLSAIGIVDTAVRVGLVTFGPFLFIHKGLDAQSVGFALCLLFIGGAAGKFLCGALAERIGIIATVVLTESFTGCGILLLTVMPLSYLLFFLPILGAALNGTSSVLYGTVADFVKPHRVARAFGLFYNFVIAAAAVAPPLMGWVSDRFGVAYSIRLVGWIALLTIPMAAVFWQQRIIRCVE